MGIFNSSSDSSYAASKNSKEGVSSTGYSSISNGKTINLSNSAVKNSDKVLSKAIDKYKCSYWQDDIKKKLLDQQKKNPKLLDDIKLIYGMNLDTFAATPGDEEAFKEQFLLPHYKPTIILKELDT